MSYRIDGLEIDPESAEGRVVADVMQRDDVTAEEAVRRVLRDHSATTENGAKARWRSRDRPPLREGDPESGIGMFADLEGFEEAIQRMISRRGERFS